MKFRRAEKSPKRRSWYEFSMFDEPGHIVEKLNLMYGEVMPWCEDQFGTDEKRWLRVNHYRISFKSQTDAAVFRLRWG